MLLCHAKIATLNFTDGCEGLSLSERACGGRLLMGSLGEYERGWNFSEVEAFVVSL